MSQPCPYCGNRNFEEEDGLMVCTSCGRQQEGGLQVGDDDAEFGTQGKLSRRKIERKKVKVTKIYRGARAYKLYLQAWQHIMWRQSYVLIHGSTKAPSELWTVAKDLWSLKLSTFLHRLDDRAQATSDEEGLEATDHTATSGDESDPPQERPKNNLNPKLWDTISLVYLAALLIRHPISHSKIYELIRSDEVPFIRAIRFVPYEISSHLPPEYQLALDTITIPQRHELQKATYNFIQSFAPAFGMEIPALNWRILLYEWIVQLGLPLEVYDVVKSLSNILAFTFAYQSPIQVDSTHGRDFRVRKSRRTPIAMPELQLMSLIVVATKLTFPFPIPHQPASRDSANDPQSTPSDTVSAPLTDLTLNWSTWHNLHKSHIDPPIGPAKHIETRDRDVAKMSPEELDDYISWYQQTFTTPDHILRQKRTGLEMSILDMFPIPDKSTPGATSTNHDTSSPQTPIDQDSITNLCQKIQNQALSYNPTHDPPPYIIFPTLDVLTSTNAIFDPSPDPKDPAANNPILFFHELAARVACTDLGALFRAVRYTEGKVEGWIGNRRRRVVVGEEEI